MMMSQDEAGSDQSLGIIKRKRTKRQRSSSTFLVATTTVTSTSSTTGGGGGGRAVSDEYNSAVSSPVTTDYTGEEEDMAICLIMLARGSVPSPEFKNSKKAEKILHQKISPENSSFYVYECKTCSRTFQSFQALGGHRASHKKPRTWAEEKTRIPLAQPKSSALYEGQNSHFKVIGSALASQASNVINKANKVHECSICGSEFSSGQALGGHMRRHRTATTAVAAELSRNSTEEESESFSRSMEQKKYLPLDLNLPAPEDDLRESKFQGIVFSATPALIDCHY